MSDVLGLRPFVPAKDFAKSIAFYEAVGFEAVHRDFTIARRAPTLLKLPFVGS